MSLDGNFVSVMEILCHFYGNYVPVMEIMCHRNHRGSPASRCPLEPGGSGRCIYGDSDDDDVNLDSAHGENMEDSGDPGKNMADISGVISVMFQVLHKVRLFIMLILLRIYLFLQAQDPSWLYRHLTLHQHLTW